MKRKLEILCDLDGIVVDLLTPWLEAYNEEYGDSVVPADITTWEVADHVKPECGFDVYKYINTPDFYANLKPLPGAVEAIAELQNEGHEVTIVTASSKNPGSAGDKIKWVAEHLGITRREVFVGHKKHKVKGDVFIDDSPKNLENYRAAWPDAAIFTIAYPYNKTMEKFVNLRAASCVDTEAAWKEIVAAVKTLANC